MPKTVLKRPSVYEKILITESCRELTGGIQMWVRKGENKDDFQGYSWTNEPVDISEIIAFVLADLAERHSQRIEEIVGPLYEPKKEKTAASAHSDAAVG